MCSLFVCLRAWLFVCGYELVLPFVCLIGWNGVCAVACVAVCVVCVIDGPFVLLLV